MAKRKKDTKGFGERFGLLKLNESPRMKSIWFHAASVGEVRSIKNLTDKIRALSPDTAIMVSTMTTTGRETAKTYLKADEAFLLPIENASAIRYLIKLMGVKVFCVVDTEIWPNMIRAASDATHIIMINARISEKTFKSYMRFRFVFKYVLKKFSIIFTKSSEDAERFGKIIGNTNNIEQSGNIKFQSGKDITKIEPLQIFNGMKLFLAASTHVGEEEFILKNIKNNTNLFDKIIIAPRHINRSSEIKSMAEGLGYQTGLYSDKNFINNKVIVIDAFGLLEKLYSQSSKIFIGGSIVPVGGHNIYEASQFYKPVASGGNFWNFKEIFLDAQKFNIVKIINTPEDFDLWLKTPEKTTRENFDEFFKLIDEKNEKTLNIIAQTIQIYLDTEKS